jgi:hypothetical protein
VRLGQRRIQRLAGSASDEHGDDWRELGRGRRIRAVDIPRSPSRVSVGASNRGPLPEGSGHPRGTAGAQQPGQLARSSCESSRVSERKGESRRSAQARSLLGHRSHGAGRRGGMARSNRSESSDRFGL